MARLIKEAVREYKLDFIVISETGRDSFSAPFLTNLAAGMDYSWFAYHLEAGQEVSSPVFTMHL
jgi:hypothetical protein